MTSLLRWLERRAENVAAALLAAMFLAFLVQIFTRYVLLRFYPGLNIGWTLEVCLTLWLWLVFFTGAFCLADRDHVKFDVLYQAVGRRRQRAFALVSALAIVIGLAAALPATIDYITFYKIKKSSVLRIRLDYVFSIYGVFAVAVIARYGWTVWRIVTGKADEELHGVTPAQEAE